MPKLWNATIKAHRHEVRHTILMTTAHLVAKHGLASITMSQIAEVTGIGRATLYKYFADVDAILVAWHKEQIAAHLEQLAEVRNRAGDARGRLEAVLATYAQIAYEHMSHGGDLASVLHRGEHVVRARQRLHGFLQDLISEAALAGDLRKDIAPGELAIYCLHALGGASQLSSKAAVRRLVAVTLAGLQP